MNPQRLPRFDQEKRFLKRYLLLNPSRAQTKRWQMGAKARTARFRDVLLAFLAPLSSLIPKSLIKWRQADRIVSDHV
jgi:hypothetical protein